MNRSLILPVGLIAIAAVLTAVMAMVPYDQLLLDILAMTAVGAVAGALMMVLRPADEH